MSTLIQRSFSGGEIAPALYARVDTVKYATGLRTCRNMIVMRHGGAQNRPGTKFVCEAKDSSKEIRLLKFVFNSDQTFILEFGDDYIRFIKNGNQVLETAKNITGITQANPAVVTSASHGYSNGQEVYISGVSGMTQVNGRNFKVAGVTANTFQLQSMDSVNINSTGFTAYASGGTCARVYEISAPYQDTELDGIQFVQSADVVTIVHPNHAPRELARVSDTNWTLSTVSFAPGISQPNGGSVVTGPAGSKNIRWRVTSVKAETYEESFTGYGQSKIISNITQANPAVVTTSTAHGLQDGEEIYISGVVGMTEVNGNKYTVDVTSGTTYELVDGNGVDVDSTGFTAYSSGGTHQLTYILGQSIGDGTPSSPHILSWTAVSDAQEYNIYRETSQGSGVYGFLGVSTGTTFRDTGIEADDQDTPPIERNPFNGSGNYPSVVTYYQQRLGLAAPDNDIEKVYFSKSGQFKNFTISSPLQDDDAVTFTLAGRQVNRIKHLVDIGKLIVLTSGGEWSVEGGNGNVLSPTDINPKQYSYYGADSLTPIVIGGNALYVQGRGSIVRDLGFDFESDGYRGTDLTIFSAHLFDDNTLVDWDYQQIPHSILWAVRNDGFLLGLTYVREQQMNAWHRHDFTDGVVERVCVIPDGNEDRTYLVIKRTVNGRTTRYIENMATRQVFEDSIEDSIFMDSALTYDGRNSGSTTMTLSGGTTWAFDESMTLTASASSFTSVDVGNQIHITGSDGTMIRFTIDAYSSGTVVTGRPHKTVPVAMRSVASAVWARAVDQVTGLWHLEGKNVSVFADGFVVANPNNDSYDHLTVAGGTINLDKFYSVIHVGLPYISDIESLDIDTPQGETLADKKKIVHKLSLFVEKSRGIWAGPKPPTDDDVDPLENLYELKIRNDESYDAPVSLATGVVDINIKPEWNSNGRVFVRQVDPVPLAVLAIAPTGYFPFRS